MTDELSHSAILGNPYKLVDYRRERKKGVTACNLQQLIKLAYTRFAIADHIKLKIVLEQDGTEIDDEEYFATLEKNANLMILEENQKWAAADSIKSTSHVFVIDETDNNDKHCKLKTGSKYYEVPGSLMTSIQNHSSDISLLADSELEMLSDMDPDSVADIESNKTLLEQLQEASDRFLIDKRRAQESITLLHMFSNQSV